jgi:UTP-glucose-1-phosphate uridylyltransferase
MYLEYKFCGHVFFSLIPRVAPSNIAVMGKYILKPSIFPILKKAHKAEGNK